MTIKNREVVERFVHGDCGHDGHGAVSSLEGGVLRSYKAKIARWEDDKIIVHDGWDGYSPTTSKHFSFLHSALEDSGVEWEADHEPEGKGTRKDRWY